MASIGRSLTVTTVVIVGNAAWVAASVTAAALGLLDLTPAGRAWALLQAIVVLVLTLQQARSLAAAREPVE